MEDREKGGMEMVEMNGRKGGRRRWRGREKGRRRWRERRVLREEQEENEKDGENRGRPMDKRCTQYQHEKFFQDVFANLCLVSVLV